MPLGRSFETFQRKAGGKGPLAARGEFYTRLLVLSICGLFACGPPEASTPAVPLAEALAPPTSAEASLKLFVFDCGRLQFDSVEAMGVKDDETSVREMAVPCYLIEHGKGRLLFEGGLASRVAEQDGWQQMAPGWRMRLDRTLAEQLGDLDLALSDLDYAAFSHFHLDHVGVASELEGVTWLARQQQYEVAFAAEVKVPGFEPDLYGALDSGKKVLFEGRYDVFDDGRVVLLPAPGHTPGHQVLLVDLAETGPVLLSGDLHVLRVARERQQVLAFDMLPETSQRSMHEIEQLLEETGAELWIGHEAAFFDQQRKAPEFYR